MCFCVCVFLPAHGWLITIRGRFSFTICTEGANLFSAGNKKKKKEQKGLAEFCFTPCGTLNTSRLACAFFCTER
jgi:hypothetical protein